jgi:hypothetical protein
MKGGVEPTQDNSFFELLGSIKEKRSHSNQGIYPNADEAAKKKAPNTKKRVVFFWLSLVMRAAHVFFFASARIYAQLCFFFCLSSVLRAAAVAVLMYRFFASSQSACSLL